MSWREKKEYAYAYPLDKASHRNTFQSLMQLRGGLVMVDPSIRRPRRPVAGRLIPGCGAYCAPAENMP